MANYEMEELRRMVEGLQAQNSKQPEVQPEPEYAAPDLGDFNPSSATLSEAWSRLAEVRNMRSDTQRNLFMKALEHCTPDEIMGLITGGLSDPFLMGEMREYLNKHPGTVGADVARNVEAERPAALARFFRLD